MKIAIYQIDLDKDKNCVAFESLECLKKVQGTEWIMSEIYDKVYECEMEGNSLEDVFQKFNIAKPVDYTARSLSVSDIVEVIESEDIEPGYYYCDSIGFEKVNFDKEKVETKMETKKIKVLVVEPEKEPYVKEIGTDLESLQREVDGYIESFYPTDDDVVFIVNDEDKINGMPMNRAMRDEDGQLYDIISGTFIIAGVWDYDFASLSPEMIEKYSERFKTPEMFICMNGKIHIMPMENPQEKEKQPKSMGKEER